MKKNTTSKFKFNLIFKGDIYLQQHQNIKMKLAIVSTIMLLKFMRIVILYVRIVQSVHTMYTLSCICFLFHRS